MRYYKPRTSHDRSSDIQGLVFVVWCPFVFMAGPNEHDSFQRIPGLHGNGNNIPSLHLRTLALLPVLQETLTKLVPVAHRMPLIAARVFHVYSMRLSGTYGRVQFVYSNQTTAAY